MRVIKIIVHVADWEATNLEKSVMKAEIVLRNGTAQKVCKAYSSILDEDCQLSIVFVDWFTNERVAACFISKHRLRKALEKIHLFPSHRP